MLAPWSQPSGRQNCQKYISVVYNPPSLVFYCSSQTDLDRCCINVLLLSKKSPQMLALETTNIYYHTLRESEIQEWLSWALWRSLQRLQWRCWSGRRWSHMKAWLRKDPLSSSLTWLLPRFSSSQAVGLRASVPCWLLAESLPQFFATWASL